MSDEKRHEMIVGGTGGQGVITIAYALAGAAAKQFKYVTRFPIYMATQRGGPAFATVIFSDEEIPAPILSNAENCVAMETGAYGRLKSEVKPGGRLFVNSSVLKKIAEPDGYSLYDVPATDLAQEMGKPQMANMIMLGVYREITGVLSEEAVLEYLGKDASEDRMAATKEAVGKGVDYAHERKWT
jgi:2-oxoglutarate ferredoxin oxidoreductase subunit gamma